MILDNEKKTEARFEALNEKFDLLAKLLIRKSDSSSSASDTDMPPQEKENVEETVEEKVEDVVEEQNENKTEELVVEIVENKTEELVEKPVHTEPITNVPTELSHEDIVRQVLNELNIPKGPEPSIDDLD